ncbi:hypothetical protein SDRG_07309 [Saprolegnia diclina VS20]|uniref:Uncharacterized protein n=1 Tax=Saprolegnia diclina (strain VS20) TaxID=1156394 RepID=T0RXM1_SAPDV|nr:hypothetical protein SDRG_07309 [Saprolegnia diclina VS20]EQC35072.1 hypothetical protein SDRG_07309 [Saprolegnia diclina VS20]|eukprot:XP_008611356.1 hypothetical protein SDRG_07309 [Saprolegnia diclina VS20]
MGSSISWCTNPTHDECLEKAPSPLLLRMHSFSFDGDAHGPPRSPSRAETPGGKLLRDYYNHVVETESNSGTDDSECADEKQVPTALLPLIHPTLSVRESKRLTIDATLHMYSTIDLRPSSAEPPCRKVRAASMDAMLRSPPRSPVAKREWAYKPFWCDLPTRALPLTPRSPAAS